MPQYDISIDLAPLAQALTLPQNVVATRVSQVVAATAQAVYERWVNAVTKAQGVWEGEKKDYVSSIRITGANAFESTVFSDYKNAWAIETGRPQRDLKKMLDTSLKVRVSAKGARYLYIPMRHNTPGHTAHAKAMPASIYDAAKQLGLSSVTGKGVRPSGTGAYDTSTKKQFLVPQNTYQWGGRLQPGLAPKIKPSHKTDPYAGMVRFTNSTGGSSFLTFRTMSENSNGWLIPAKPGLFLARDIADEMRPLFEQAMIEAIKGAVPTL